MEEAGDVGGSEWRGDSHVRETPVTAELANAGQISSQQTS